MYDKYESKVNPRKWRRSHIDIEEFAMSHGLILRVRRQRRFFKEHICFSVSGIDKDVRSFKKVFGPTEGNNIKWDLE